MLKQGIRTFTIRNNALMSPKNIRLEHLYTPTVIGELTATNAYNIIKSIRSGDRAQLKTILLDLKTVLIPKIDDALINISLVNGTLSILMEEDSQAQTQPSISILNTIMPSTLIKDDTALTNTVNTITEESLNILNSNSEIRYRYTVAFRSKARLEIDIEYYRSIIRNIDTIVTMINNVP